MNRDLHDIDDLFRAGLDDYEATPSAGVKENLDAALDKQDAEKYKKRFLIWKRAALLLLLLVAGFVLYESGIIKTGGRSSAAKTSASVNNDKAEDKTEIVNPNTNTTVNSNTDIIVSNNPAIQKENAESGETQKENTPVPGGTVAADKNRIDKKITLSKNNQPGKQFNPFITDKNPFVSITSSQPDKKINNAAGYDVDLQTSQRGITPLDERTSVSKIAERFIKNIQPLSSITVSNSPLKANNVANSKTKKVKSFKPFWMIASFASYERAGYRLDSDLPINITSIKHREAHEPSFSTGIFITRQLTKSWGLQTGLVYSNTAIGISPQKIYALQNGADVAYKYITSSGYAYIKPGFGTPPSVGDSLSTTEAKHRLQYVSIPVVIKYTVSKRKLSFTPGAGIEANFLTGAKIETEIKDASNLETVIITKLKGAKSFYWSAIAEAELQYSISKKVSVSFRPAFRYAISPITKNNVVETFPRSFSLGLGVKIKL